jgi:undecaprenyl-diphosphatase
VGASALPGSFSFPSGHASAAAASYGYIAYLAIRRTHRLRWQILIAIGAAVTIVGVGYSRVVLGFHWTSDVLAGTLLGLLIAAGAALYADIRPGRELRWPKRLPIARWIFGGVAVALVAIAAVSATRRGQHAPVIPALPTKLLPDTAITRATLRSFPLYSETLTGRRMEPVSLILVGTRDQIIGAFRAAGWSLADPIDLHSVLRIYGAGLRHRPYPTAPVTPAFLGGRPQDLAFERDVEAGSVAKRHHARVWFSGQALFDGSPIWLATASLDDRLEIKLTTLLPNHHIAPDIDTERDLIARALRSTGMVTNESILQAVPPQVGSNAAGDPFFTYGKAVVIRLN